MLSSRFYVALPRLKGRVMHVLRTLGVISGNTRVRVLNSELSGRRAGSDEDEGHVFYLATNDAKTKHSAATKKKLTPVDQQGGGWCLTCAF